jgi:hypothetical protein
MLTTSTGRKTQLQEGDLIKFRRERRENRVYIYRHGRPILVNGKEYFSFPRAKNLAEQFEWMCWFADAVGEAMFLRFGPPNSIIIGHSKTLTGTYLKE